MRTNRDIEGPCIYLSSPTNVKFKFNGKLNGNGKFNGKPRDLCLILGFSFWTLGNFFFLWRWLHTATDCSRSCGVSILGDIQKLSGHGPGQLALDGSVWAGVLDQMTSRGPLHLQDIIQTFYFYRHEPCVSFWPIISVQIPRRENQ